MSAGTWNAKSQQITVTFDDATTSVDKIGKAIAKGRNDTPNHKASDEANNKLPDCCKYEHGQ